MHKRLTQQTRGREFVGSDLPNLHSILRSELHSSYVASMKGLVPFIQTRHCSRTFVYSSVYHDEQSMFGLFLSSDVFKDYLEFRSLKQNEALTACVK